MPGYEDALRFVDLGPPLRKESLAFFELGQWAMSILHMAGTRNSASRT